jgi:hypothetical protein
VTLRVEGDRLLTCGPQGALTDADRSAIRERKLELLAALRPECDLVEQARVLEARDALASFSCRTPFGDVVIVLDQGGEFDRRVAEEQAKPEPARRPVVWSTDLHGLRGKSPQAIAAALEIWRAFPGARLEQ